MVASRVGKLHLIDASAAALKVARGALSAIINLEFHHASVDAMALKSASLDFAYSLGVLHHVPDTVSAIRSIAAKLKIGAPPLLYHRYSRDEIRVMLESAGFVGIEFSEAPPYWCAVGF